MLIIGMDVGAINEILARWS